MSHLRGRGSWGFRVEGGLVERAGSVRAESVRSGRVLHGRTVCQGQAGSVMKEKSVREGQGLLAQGRDFMADGVFVEGGAFPRWAWSAVMGGVLIMGSLSGQVGAGLSRWAWSFVVGGVCGGRGLSRWAWPVVIDGVLITGRIRQVKVGFLS